MTPIAQMDCCTMLGIDPKTLRNWLRHAHMQFVAHPTDARLKCLTPEQIHQLATLHARPLQMSPAASSALLDEAVPLDSSEGRAAAAQENEAQLVPAATSLSEEAELRKAVCGREAKVMTLQEHLTQLTLELLRERSERYERRLSTWEALLPQSAGRSPLGQELVPIVVDVPRRLRDCSSPPSCEHVLASLHALNMELRASMCSSVHGKECLLSPLIRGSGLTGSPPSPLSALSGHRAVLRPTEKA